MTIQDSPSVPRIPEADTQGQGDRARVRYKRRKIRAERRRARLDPECTPAYGLYRRWLA